MIKVESILKWKVEGPVLKKLKMIRSQVLSKNSDAVALADEDLHVTLASGPGWQKLKNRAKADDFDEPEFKIDIEPTSKVMEAGPKKSWYVRMKGQEDWKEYVMDLLQGTHDARRVYHISIANLSGKKEDSVAMVEDRDYKDEYKKFQSSKKSKKYRAELNRYNRHKGTYGNHDRKDASHRGGKIVGFEDESANRGRAEKSRLPKKEIEESIKLEVQPEVRKYFDKNFEGMKLAFSTHAKKHHTEREIAFNAAKLIGTLKRFLKRYKSALPTIARSTPSGDFSYDDNRHYIYDKRANYSLIFAIKEGIPEIFLILTAYPDRPRNAGKLTAWEV